MVLPLPEALVDEINGSGVGGNVRVLVARSDVQEAAVEGQSVVEVAASVRGERGKLQTTEGKRTRADERQ